MVNWSTEWKVPQKTQAQSRCLAARKASHGKVCWWWPNEGESTGINEQTPVGPRMSKIVMKTKMLIFNLSVLSNLVPTALLFYVQINSVNRLIAAAWCLMMVINMFLFVLTWAILDIIYFSQTAEFPADLCRLHLLVDTPMSKVCWLWKQMLCLFRFG